MDQGKSSDKPMAPPNRRFRFGLRTFLVIPVLLAAGLGWWLTWPQRAATNFIHLMETDPARAQAMSKSGGGMAGVLLKYQHDAPYLEPHPRSISDVLRGNQTFTVAVPVIGPKLDGREMEFTATLFFEGGSFRGPIELRPRPQKILE